MTYEYVHVTSDRRTREEDEKKYRKRKKKKRRREKTSTTATVRFVDYHQMPFQAIVD